MADLFNLLFHYEPRLEYRNLLWRNGYGDAGPRVPACPAAARFDLEYPEVPQLNGLGIRQSLNYDVEGALDHKLDVDLFQA